MCGDVVAVEVGRVRVRVVAHLAAVGVALLHAEAADADGVPAAAAALLRALGGGGGRGGGGGGVRGGVERGQLGLRRLELEGGEVAVSCCVRGVYCGGGGQECRGGRHSAGVVLDGGVVGGGGGRGGGVAEPAQSVGQPLLPELLHVDGVLHLGGDGGGGRGVLLLVVVVVMMMDADTVVLLLVIDGAAGAAALVESRRGRAPGDSVLLLEAEVLRLRLPALGGRVGQLEPAALGGGGVGGDGGGAAVAAVLVLAGASAVVAVHVQSLLGHLADEAGDRRRGGGG